MQKKTNLHIFQSNINNSYKPMPFNIKSSDVGHMKYLPPVSRE
jgi:hypothetical protein